MYAMVPYMVTDRDAQGMRVGHVKDLRNCHGSATDCHVLFLYEIYCFQTLEIFVVVKFNDNSNNLKIFVSSRF